MGNDKIEAGFFTVDTLNKIDAAKDLREAKKIAMDAIAAQPNARPNNVKKATSTVQRATSKQGLMIALSNFMLAHPSEDLGMNKQ